MGTGARMTDPSASTEGERREPGVPERSEMHGEVDSFTGGPGVVATKSQARGGLAGAVVGAIVGALLGLLVGVLFLDAGSGIVIAVVAFAVAGATTGGVAGGFVQPRRKGVGDSTDV